MAVKNKSMNMVNNQIGFRVRHGMSEVGSETNVNKCGMTEEKLTTEEIERGRAKPAPEY